MLQPLSATSRVMKIGISSKEMSLLDLSMTAYWKIRFRLLRVPGVANVAMWGERLKQLQIQVDPDRMRVHERDAERGPGGASRTPSTSACCRFDFQQDAHGRRVHRHAQPALRHSCRVSPVMTPEDLAKVPVRYEAARRYAWATWPMSSGSEPLLIGDCGHQRRPRPDAHRREVAVGQHACRSPAASKRRSRR